MCWDDGALIVSDLFPSLFKSFKPLGNLSTRYTLIAMNFRQQIIRFCSGFSKFHTEFHIDALLHVNTSHDSDGEQEHEPLQAKATAKLFAARPWNCNHEWRGEHTARCCQVSREVEIKSGYFIATPRIKGIVHPVSG